MARWLAAVCVALGVAACSDVGGTAPGAAPGTALPSAQRGEVDGFDAASCTYDGVALYGRVSTVDDFADFEVRVVSDFPDLRVQRVEDGATSCGQWQLVEDFPDFTIRLVEDFPDFTIQFVDAFPGTEATS